MLGLMSGSARSSAMVKIRRPAVRSLSSMMVWSRSSVRPDSLALHPSRFASIRGVATFAMPRSLGGGVWAAATADQDAATRIVRSDALPVQAILGENPEESHCAPRSSAFENAAWGLVGPWLMGVPSPR